MNEFSFLFLFLSFSFFLKYYPSNSRSALCGNLTFFKKNLTNLFKKSEKRLRNFPVFFSFHTDRKNNPSISKSISQLACRKLQPINYFHSSNYFFYIYIHTAKANSSYLPPPSLSSSSINFHGVAR